MTPPTADLLGQLLDGLDPGGAAPPADRQIAMLDRLLESFAA
jgi:hypothetical protein